MGTLAPGGFDTKAFCEQVKKRGGFYYTCVGWNVPMKLKTMTSPYIETSA
jgi:hypothetical protein